MHKPLLSAVDAPVSLEVMGGKEPHTKTKTLGKIGGGLSCGRPGMLPCSFSLATCSSLLLLLLAAAVFPTAAAHCMLLCCVSCVCGPSCAFTVVLCCDNPTS